MRNSILVNSVLANILIAGCAPSAGKPNANLECAALINAASQLSARGDLDTEPEFNGQALFSGMMHLNTYAIPNKITEAEAFEQMNSRRDTLIETNSPSRIFKDAKSCIRKTPQQ
ncbi:MAG: hypothetical protein NXH72_14460 [Hyphomonadaceae bacterium]|nr:hypothetical protein [Hyphomonadaceae bacterium]